MGSAAASQALQERTEICFGKIRQDFHLVVVVVDAVGKPNPLGIDLKCLPIRSGFVALVGVVNGFNRFADREIVLAMLVVNDVAPGKCGFTKVVNEGFLADGEFVEPREIVPENLKVCKGVEQDLLCHRRRIRGGNWLFYTARYGG